MPQREFYIDRLRSVIVALVILHHTAITYGAIGGWFWREVGPSSAASSVLLVLFCTTNQAYFMGLFFLLAGYFTPASLERKGYARFIAGRFLRLGLPLLAFILILGPLTSAIVNFAQGNGFWPAIRWIWRHKEFINGPLWFAQALLIFSLVYCAWRAIFGSPLVEQERVPRPVPGGRWWLVSALGVGAAALAIRQFVPVGVNVFGLQLGYFAGYVFLFAVGIAAWRHDWLVQLDWRQARPWIITLLIAWPCLQVGIAVACALHRGGSSGAPSGLSFEAILYALWEPFVAWGLIAAGLLVFRERMNHSSVIWAWLNRRAYAVYIIHPPVLVSIALLLHGWAAPALLKFGVVGLAACGAAWLAADPLVRLPGVRSVV
jgi:peptidoglycan/LPS O-acetylase OafA/YrhL